MPGMSFDIKAIHVPPGGTVADLVAIEPKSEAIVSGDFDDGQINRVGNGRSMANVLRNQRFPAGFVGVDSLDHIQLSSEAS